MVVSVKRDTGINTSTNHEHERVDRAQRAIQDPSHAFGMTPACFSNDAKQRCCHLPSANDLNHLNGLNVLNGSA